ncbi:nodulation efficiency protein NfeD [Shimazuella sp. AN120528]|uniref:NfeD family protein n=1 Tax=Shimazuella soli TaxID=1892854 RepID=UPI001F0E7E44|nr:NfeD family protein [Shimazuella soli]MCH5583860.1 nodulation efficiency protein NfeD [Shimazuella soli]
MTLGTTMLVASTSWDIVTHPAIMAILLTIGLAGIFVELLAPGHIIPGAIGIGAFVLYFYGQFAAGIAEWSAPVIFIVGLILLIIEMFVPGGIFGTLGTVALFYSVVAAAKSLAVGLSALAIGVVATVLLIWILYKFFGFRTTWRKIILSSQQNNEEGYTSSKNRKHLIGKKGTALSALRPAGWAMIDGRKEDVVSEGDLIPKDATIIVTNVEGTRVVVKKVDEEIE